MPPTSRKPILPPFIQTEVGDKKIILTGILHPDSIAPTQLGAGLRLESPELALKALLPQLRGQCDLLVLLAFADEDNLRQLAEQFYEPDFILGGDVSQPSGNTRQINQSQVFYVGTQSCTACHQAEHEIWKDTGHAHAWQTLVYKKADADPNCIACHSVGFGSESGYRREFKHEKLVNVGCESCHGPGSQHVEERTAGGSINQRFHPLAEGDCRTCHYGEFSRPFDWDVFWPRVAHGQLTANE